MEIRYHISIDEDESSTFVYYYIHEAEEKLKQLRSELPHKHINMWRITEEWDWMDADPKYGA